MNTLVSQAEARKAVKRAEKIDQRLRRLREEHKSSLESATRTAATMGGAFAVAWFMGRYPDRREIMGLDASLVIGGGLTVAAMMGWAGENDSIVEALGTGALAVYASSKGYALGTEQQQAA